MPPLSLGRLLSQSISLCLRLGKINYIARPAPSPTEAFALCHSHVLHPPVFLRELEISRASSNDLIFPEEAIPSHGSRKRGCIRLSSGSHRAAVLASSWKWFGYSSVSAEILPTSAQDR